MKELVEAWSEYIDWLDDQVMRGMRDDENSRNYTFGDFMDWLKNEKYKLF